MENQLSLLEQNTKSCVFTGHRTLDRTFSLLKLKNEVKKLIKKGVEVFYVGMARGFDMTAAKVVLGIKKKKENVKLIACVPCLEQEKYYTDDEKKEYVEILQKADEVIYVSKSYYNGCMLKRNRYMADRADVMIAYCRKDDGGTAYTANYFQRKYPEKEFILI